MPIQAPNEKPAIQQERASGLIDLRPVERGRRIRQFPDAVVERALAAADAAEIEAQHRKAAVHERVIELVDDLVVHRAAELRMRMQHDGDRRMLGARRMVAAFDTAGRTGEDDFGHSDLDTATLRVRARVFQLTARLTGPAGARNV